jgi:2,5-diketo-D-gluconate reductase B
VPVNQAALAFLLRLGSIVIPKSAMRERQKSNLDAGDVTLDDTDMAELAKLDRGERHIKPSWGPAWD